MPPRTGRPDHLSRALNVRLTEREYRHIVAQATLAEVPLSEALRRCLDRDIDAQPDLTGDVNMTYPTLLDGIKLEEALEQLREAGLA